MSETRLMDLEASVSGIRDTIKDLRDIKDAATEQRGQATMPTERILSDLVDKLDEFTSHQVAYNRQQRISAESIYGRDGTISFDGARRVHQRGHVNSNDAFDGVPVDHIKFVRNFMRRADSMQKGQVKYTHGDVLESHYQRYFGDDGESRAFTTDTAGSGLELIDTKTASRLWEDFHIQSRVFANLVTFDQPTNPFIWPYQTDWVWSKGAENTAPTEHDPTTAKTTFTATEQVCNVNWPYSFTEDAAIAVMPEFEKELARSGAEYMDAFCMNADATSGATGNINSDDGAPASGSYYLSDGEDGLRHQFLVDNSSQEVNANGSLTDTHLLTAIANLDKYGVGNEDVLCFPGPAAYLMGMIGLTQLRTVDVFGPKATIKTGQVANYNGTSVIPTIAVPKTEADGKVSTTASNNDKGQIVFAHKTGWRCGVVRRVLIEVDRDIKKRQWILVGSFRISIAARGTRSSALHTSGIRNITV